MFRHDAEESLASITDVGNDRTMRNYEDIPAWYLTQEYEAGDGQAWDGKFKQAPTKFQRRLQDFTNMLQGSVFLVLSKYITYYEK